jgi:hypothetical protein
MPAVAWQSWGTLRNPSDCVALFPKRLYADHKYVMSVWWLSDKQSRLMSNAMPGFAPALLPFPPHRVISVRSCSTRLSHPILTLGQLLRLLFDFHNYSICFLNAALGSNFITFSYLIYPKSRLHCYILIFGLMYFISFSLKFWKFYHSFYIKSLQEFWNIWRVRCLFVCVCLWVYIYDCCKFILF